MESVVQNIHFPPYKLLHYQSLNLPDVISQIQKDFIYMEKFRASIFTSITYSNAQCTVGCCNDGAFTFSY